MIAAEIFSGVTGEEVKTFILIVFGFLMLWKTILDIKKSREKPEKQTVTAPPPQPLIVAEAVKYVEMAEFKELHREVKRIAAVLPEMETRNREDRDESERRITEAGEGRVVKIHERINKLAEEVAKGVQLAADTEKSVNRLISVMRDRNRRNTNEHGN